MTAQQQKEHELNTQWEKEWLQSIGLHRGIAIKILDAFEDMLDAKSISIPDDDRTGEESEACLYGTTYADLENEIVSILDRYLEG